MNSDFDLSKCLIDFSKIKPGQRMIEAFPELSAFPEFKLVQEDKWIKVAILLSDFDSPFLKIKDNELRLRAIYDYVEIGLKTQKNQEEFQEVLEYKHIIVIDCCSRYLQMQNNHDFASWWSSNLLYYELIKEKNAPKSPGDSIDVYTNRKLKIEDNLERILVRIKEKEAMLFKDSKMRMAIARSQVQKIKTYPEQMAEENTVE